MIASFSALLFAAGVLVAQTAGEPAGAVFLASGARVGEVNTTSAVVWTRTTAEPQRRAGDEVSGRPVVTLEPGGDPSTLEGAVPGAPGEVRVTVSRRDGSG
ncbi:MAG: hypothetical protein J4F98_12910, partial [Acidobacteria bacterium]|nr:hypothetical protein [Acidobacteriota bacterium]